MKRPSDLLSDDQFELAVNHLADAMMLGSDASRYVGSGIDYAQSRLYSAGDPVKSIDWRVTARSGKVHVKEFESLKQMPVYLVVDQSASMDVASKAKSKWEWSILLAGALGLAAIRASRPAGIISGNLETDGDRGDGRVDSLNVEPSLDRTRIFRWLTHLRRMALFSRDPTHVGRMLDALNVVASKAATVIILSDLHENGVAKPIARLAQKHDTVVLRLRDPAEVAMPVRGLFRVAEAETGRRFFTRQKHGLSPGHDSECELRTGGIRVMTLPTDQDFLPALREFLRTSHRAGTN